MHIQGYDLTRYTLGQPRDKIVIDQTGYTCTTTILALYASWTRALPVLYSPHAVYVGVRLSKIDCAQEEEFGELCLVILTYDQRFSNTPTTPLPQPQYGSNGESVELPIQKHPNFVGTGGQGPWSQWWNTTTQQFDPNYSPPVGPPPGRMPAFLSGVTKFFAGACTVWTKVYYYSQPGSALPDGTIQDPGFGYGPSGHYLATTCDEQKENAFWYRLTHYKYSAVQWPTELYTNPNTPPAGTLNQDGSISG